MIRPRPLLALGAVAAILAATIGPASPASAASGATIYSNGDGIRVAGAGNSKLTVKTPGDVAGFDVILTGGDGGSSNGIAGGGGASVEGRFLVGPTSNFSVTLGAAGGAQAGGAGALSGGPGGGSPLSSSGAGGGAASAIWVTQKKKANAIVRFFTGGTEDIPLLVAGGGGGAGGTGSNGVGGAGGLGGAPVTAGSAGLGTPGVPGGAGGTARSGKTMRTLEAAGTQGGYGSTAASKKAQGGGGGAGGGFPAGNGGHHGNTSGTGNMHSGGGGGAAGGSYIDLSSGTLIAMTNRAGARQDGEALISWVRETKVAATGPGTLYADREFTVPVSLSTVGSSEGGTGIVTVSLGNTVLTSAQVTGAATLTVPGLDAGTHELTVAYTPDTAHRLPSRTTFPVTVKPLTVPETRLEIIPDLVDGTHTVTATAWAGSAASTATVTLHQIADDVDTVVATGTGTARVTVPNAAASRFDYVATVAATATDTPARTEQKTFVPAAPVTRVRDLPLQPTTVVFTTADDVSDAEVVVHAPEGVERLVELLQDGVVVDSATSTSGATLHATAATAGEDTLAVHVDGEPVATADITWTPRATDVELVLDPVAPVAGQEVTATVTVMTSDGAPVPDGEVTIGDEEMRAAYRVDNGRAVTVIGNYPLGETTLTATYVANGSFDTSADADAITVVAAPTTVTLSEDADDDARTGTDVTLTATVASASPAAATTRSIARSAAVLPTGTVTFSSSDGSTLGTAPVIDGVATLSVPDLAAYGQTIVAAFASDEPGFAPSVSEAVAVELLPVATSVSIEAEDAGSDESTVRVHVAAADGTAGAPSGLVQVAVDGEFVATLSATSSADGTTTFAADLPLALAGHTLTATFIGSLDFTDATADLVVAAPAASPAASPAPAALASTGTSGVGTGLAIAAAALGAGLVLIARRRFVRG